MAAAASTAAVRGPPHREAGGRRRAPGALCAAALLGAGAAWPGAAGGVRAPPTAFARKHAVPTGKWALIEAVRAGGASRQEHLSTLASLRTAYEEDILKWGYRRQWEQALASFAEMEEHSLERDSAAYNAAVRACSEKARQWQEAVFLLSEMQGRGFHPSTEAVKSTLFACAKGRDRTPALAGLHWLRRCAAPDTATFSNALRACRSGALWEEALALLRDMDSLQLEPDEAMFNLVLDTCEEADEEEWYDWVEDRAAERGFGIRL